MELSEAEGHPGGYDSPELSNPWYAIHVRSNFEWMVFHRLQEKGYPIFLPTYHVERQLCDRRKNAEVPLFPGYLFCRFDPRNRLPVLTVPGVVQILGYGKYPEPVSEDEVRAVQTIAKSRLPYMPGPSFIAGQHIVVEQGPLMGVQGLLIESRDRHRMAVSITMLQRTVVVEIDARWVRTLP